MKVKSVNLRVVNEKEAFKYASVQRGDLTIKGTPQGLKDFTRDPLFLVHHKKHLWGRFPLRPNRGALFLRLSRSLSKCAKTLSSSISQKMLFLKLVESTLSSAPSKESPQE